MGQGVKKSYVRGDLQPVRGEPLLSEHLQLLRDLIARLEREHVDRFLGRISKLGLLIFLSGH